MFGEKNAHFISYTSNFACLQKQLKGVVLLYCLKGCEENYIHAFSGSRRAKINSLLQTSYLDFFRYVVVKFGLEVLRKCCTFYKLFFFSGSQLGQ
jgi:hypothetical protein